MRLERGEDGDWPLWADVTTLRFVDFLSRPHSRRCWLSVFLIPDVAVNPPSVLSDGVGHAGLCSVPFEHHRDGDLGSALKLQSGNGELKPGLETRRGQGNANLISASSGEEGEERQGRRWASLAEKARVRPDVRKSFCLLDGGSSASGEFLVLEPVRKESPSAPFVLTYLGQRRCSLTGLFLEACDGNTQGDGV